MATYELTRQFATTDQIEVDLDQLKTRINAEYVSRGIDAYVDTVKKVRGQYEDVFVVYTYASTSSPLEPGTVLVILVSVLSAVAIVGISVTAYIFWTLYNKAMQPYDDLKNLINNIVDGLSHSDVADMIAYLQKNYPSWTAGKSFCDLCGQAFMSVERMTAHRLACPDLKPTVPGPYPPATVFDQLWTSLTQFLKKVGLPVPPKPPIPSG